MAAEIHFYLDENVPVAVAEQLRRRGIVAVTVRDLGLLGESDINHLNLTIAEGRVLYTHDADYIGMYTGGTDHLGIIFGQQQRHGVGDWVKFLELVYSVYTANETKNRLEYV